MNIFIIERIFFIDYYIFEYYTDHLKQDMSLVLDETHVVQLYLEFILFAMITSLVYLI